MSKSNAEFIYFSVSDVLISQVTCKQQKIKEVVTHDPHDRELDVHERLTFSF